MIRSVLFSLLLASSVLNAAPPERWTPVEKPWDRSLGTHRVVVKVDEKFAAQKGVVARMEWRRPDREPEKKAVLVYDLKTGKQVMNVDVGLITNEEGVILFEPVSGPGEYAVYFLPAKIEGGAFPVGKYLPPQKTADETWHKEHGSGAPLGGMRAPAEVVRWEAITAHDAWTEMEVIATEAERAEFEKKFNTPYGPLFIEDGRHSVRMADQIPRRWLSRTPPELTARPGEYFVFQVVLHATSDSNASIGIKLLEPVTVRKPGSPRVLKADDLSGDGINWEGKEARRTFTAQKGKVQVFWVGVDIPRELLKGTVTVPIQFHSSDSRYSLAGNLEATIKVEGEPIADHGDSNPQSLSRLRWLNSTTAVDDEPVQGYEPLTVKGRTIRCLGRELELGEDGLPVQIRSYFNKAVTKVMETPQVEMLNRKMKFGINPKGGSTFNLEGRGMEFTLQIASAVEWKSELAAENARAVLTGRMEFDGSVHYRIALTAVGSPVEIDHAGMSSFMKGEAVDLALGLQQEAGAAPNKLVWNWDTANKNQDSLWLGSVNGGIRYQFRSDNYVRPSVNIHYKRRPLNDPPSWNAGGKGTIRAGRYRLEDLHEYGLAAFSDEVMLHPGETLHFDFDLLITPFHTLRTKEQWSERYYHTGGVPQDYAKYLDSAKSAGANIVNIHQGNWLNPYINYPFLTADKLGAFAKAAHDRGMRSKYYYTVRELSNWAPELFAFRSMGDEILMSGKGGGHPWGEEHLGGNYWGAWYEPGVQDVSYLTQPMSRLHNYYVEGLRWLCENAGCDGIYLDDISYDRAIMLRARKVLDRYCPRGGRIDLHSWNEFHEGGAWAHCANIFMDSMPFVDRLWFGEGHHYTGPPPEHFLVELSGIPFGLMGEMLEGGGNPWLGLVHGMTGRLGWGGQPAGVWQLWDDFGVQDAEFIGWWAEEECPVRCADPLVKATVWKKNDATLVAVANFGKEPKQAALEIDWKALGRDPAKAKLYFPAISVPKQKASLREVNSLPMLQPYAGAVFIIDEMPHDIAAPAAAEALGATLLDDDFSKGLDAAWKPIISPRAKDAGKVDAGYVLQMPVNLHGYLERDVPAEAGAVTARIWQDGKDEAQQWGPGLALVWPDGKTLRTNIRKDMRLTVSANGSENLDASASVRAPVEFTVRWDKDTVRIVAAGPAMGDLPEEIARFPRSQFPGQPSLLRVGKMPNSTGPQDHADAGPIGFNRIEWVRAHAAR